MVIAGRILTGAQGILTCNIAAGDEKGFRANGGDGMLTDVSQSRKLWQQPKGDGEALADF